METLIGILLFIGAIGPNSTYYESELHQLEEDNYDQIQMVEEDSEASWAAEQMYEQHHMSVIVLDDPIL